MHRLGSRLITFHLSILFLSTFASANSRLALLDETTTNGSANQFSLLVETAPIAGSNATTAGARWQTRLANQGTVGLFLRSLVSNVRTEDSELLSFYYGGACLGLTFWQWQSLNFETGFDVGIGKVGFRSKTTDKFQEDSYNIIQPQVGVFSLLTRNVDFGIEFSYRVTRGVNLKSYDNNSFTSPALAAMIRTGLF